MSDLGLVILQLGGLFTGLINIYIWVIIIAALLSFVNPDPYNPIVQFLRRITEPSYKIVRKTITTNINGIDLAPLVIVIALQVVIVLLSYIFKVLAQSV
ncbi:MAG: YggT family protein [Sulfurimonas sp.]|jgi:YggT family protein|nr:YggT family protein [Sulfurimonas sp.]MBU1216215.1 YggT family protein [bacterium]MBU1434521.1 YggT family protein [bacterium]MBU1502099.1 YggT family protein [bacterium]MBU3937933.1 YggT family protein [bacterium]